MMLNSPLPDDASALVSPSVPQVVPRSEGQPLKLGILASGQGSNFVAIANAIQSQTLAAQIQVVITNNPDAKVLDHAQERGFPTRCLNHREIKPRSQFDQRVVAELQAFDVDWVIMVGWMRRATQVLIDAFPHRILNIHPSLLPSFPGIRAIEQALDYGVTLAGCTVHIVTLEVDSGPILMQAAVPVLPDDTPETLHQRIQVQEHRIIVAVIAQLTTHSMLQA